MTFITIDNRRPYNGTTTKRPRSNVAMSAKPPGLVRAQLEQDGFTEYVCENPEKTRQFVIRMSTDGTIRIKYITTEGFFRQGGVLIDNERETFFILSGINFIKFPVKYEKLDKLYYKIKV